VNDAVAPEGAPGPAGPSSGAGRNRLITVAAAAAGVVVGAVTMGLIDRDDAPTPMELRSGPGFDGDQGTQNMPGFGDGGRGGGNQDDWGGGPRGRGQVDPDGPDGPDGDGGDRGGDSDQDDGDDGRSFGEGPGGFVPPGGGGPQGSSGAS
jgi:hypothetical protein